MSSNGCKFQMTEPGGGNPFHPNYQAPEAGSIDQQMQEQVQGDVNDRMGAAMNDLRQKAAGMGGKADKWAVSHGGNDQVVPAAKQRFAGDDAGYMEADHPENIARALREGKIQPVFRARSTRRHDEDEEEYDDDEAAEEAAEEAAVRAEEEAAGAGGAPEEDSDDEFDDLLDDPELEKIRNRRLGAIKAHSEQRAAWLAKGHGQYRDITEDAFLEEVTGSEYTLVHFYHKDFERCKVIDHHLKVLSTKHLDCKFLKINAEKSLFFNDKLKVQVLPTVITFRDGIAQNDERIVGFDGLCDHLPPGQEDTFTTQVVERKLAEIGVLRLEEEVEELEHERKNKTSIFAGSKSKQIAGDDDDLWE